MGENSFRTVDSLIVGWRVISSKFSSFLFPWQSEEEDSIHLSLSLRGFWLRLMPSRMTACHHLFFFFFLYVVDGARSLPKVALWIWPVVYNILRLLSRKRERKTVTAVVSKPPQCLQRQNGHGSNEKSHQSFGVFAAKQESALFGRKSRKKERKKELEEEITTMTHGTTCLHTCRANSAENEDFTNGTIYCFPLLELFSGCI